MADNPELADADVPLEEITPETHRNLVFRQHKPDGGLVEFELIRSLAWIEWTGAEAGRTVELDLNEFGVDGPAEIVDIQPCPTLEEGPGRLVTGTFRHTAHNVIEVYIAGLDEPIGVTANHPIWSEDRQAFVAAAELRPGEAVLQADGQPGRIARVIHTPRTATVHNIEVDGEHVYYVSATDVLVHNTCVKSVALGKGRGLSEFADEVGASYWKKWREDGLTLKDPLRKRFGKLFKEVIGDADEVHFNLNGVGDPIEAARKGKRGYSAANDNMTNAELLEMARNPEWWSKTKWYKTIDGILQEVPNPFQNGVPGL